MDGNGRIAALHWSAPSKEHRSLQSSAKHVLIRGTNQLGHGIIPSGVSIPSTMTKSLKPHLQVGSLSFFVFLYCPIRSDMIGFVSRNHLLWDKSSLFSSLFIHITNSILNEKSGFRLLAINNDPKTKCLEGLTCFSVHFGFHHKAVPPQSVPPGCKPRTVVTATCRVGRAGRAAVAQSDPTAARQATQHSDPETPRTNMNFHTEVP